MRLLFEGELLLESNYSIIMEKILIGIYMLGNKNILLLSRLLSYINDSFRLHLLVASINTHLQSFISALKRFFTVRVLNNNLQINVYKHLQTHVNGYIRLMYINQDFARRNAR